MTNPREARALELERWLSDELDPVARERFERSVAEPERSAAREADRVLREQLLSALPPERFAQRVQARVAAASQTPGRAVRGWIALPVLSLATLALVWWVGMPVLQQPQPRPNTDVPADPNGDRATAVPAERAKGLQPRLLVHRQRRGQGELLADGAPCRAGDVVQLGYVSAARVHGAILSLDGGGGVTLHFPGERNASEPFDPGGGEHLLPAAFELDDAPSFERFVLISAARPISLPDVLAAARALAAQPSRAQREPLALPSWYEQHTVLLRKER